MNNQQQELLLKKNAALEKELIAKNRELEIESSLERVRTVAMSMNKPDDMLHVCQMISEQLEQLNVKEIRNVQTAIFYISRGTYMNYEFYAKHKKAFITETIYTNHKIAKAFAAKMLKGKGEVSITHIDDKEKVQDWLAYQKTTNVFIDKFLEKADSLNYYWHSLGPVALGISTYFPLREDELKLFQRFMNVFELSYTRYLDIEQAIAQSREALIEAALEKVRSRSLAVLKSDEFNDVIKIVFEKLQELGIVASSVSINIFNEGSKDAEAYICGQNEDELSVSHIHLIYFDHPIYNDRYNVQQSGLNFFSKNYSYEEKHSFFEHLFKVSELKYLPDDIKKMVFQNKSYTISMALTKNSMIVINDFEGNFLSDKEIDIAKRFSKVFEQAYVRFLDLQKAETQTRESQIQLALERVRARTMAMQHSDELSGTASEMFRQILLLGLKTWSCGFNIIDKEKRLISQWVSTGDGRILPAFITPSDEDVFKRFTRAAQKDKSFYVEEMGGDALQAHYKYMGSLPEAKKLLDEFQSLEITPPDFQVFNLASFSYGYLMFITYQHAPEFHDVFKRFAKVFKQTYTRFLDLQKAEAQTKEAHIEAALERVRSRSMGMQKSEELKEIIKVVYEQFVHLNILVEHAGFLMDYKARDDMHIWLADQHNIPSRITIPYFDSPHWNSFKEAKEKGLDFFANHLNFEEKNRFYQDLFKLFPGVPDEAKEYYFSSPGLAISTVLLDNVGLYIENFSAIPYSDKENATLMRFGKVFQQTYTRFLDLQKAEEQAREAQIEVALERIRARALAMQTSNDLLDVAKVLRDQMGILGQPELESSLVHIYHSNPERFEAWYSFKPPNNSLNEIITGSSVVCKNSSEWAKEVFDKYASADTEYTIVASGYKLLEWYKVLEQIAPRTVTYDDNGQLIVPEILYYHFSKFSGGSLLMISEKEPALESRELQKRSAIVFDLAYTRFLDLQKAEAQALRAEQDLVEIKTARQRAEHTLNELQITQKQLVQTEKMASLGELTAGIAHEIQNPLNFVNNFSEVNKELLVEMKDEMDKGNLEDAKAIANDVIDNEEKINHHGKRADAIVRGMLQHSRSSSGVKEPTDINKLADEYLRLCYHGLRAKDKSFNAAIKTDFDNTIGKINIVPQDIGRVILNLLTNAFYAASLPSPEKIGINTGVFSNSDNKRTPAVWLRTKKENGKILISVRDNGPGIPQKVLDKIFQPFFTTKPTGQGTGLGLSLSYDIIKVHGGEIKVETKENEGTEFTIQLPASIT